MEKAETLQEYYRRTNKIMPKDLEYDNAPTHHFNILKRSNCFSSLPYQRRDYYKICLLKDPLRLHTENAVLEMDKPCIIFSNPRQKYGWESSVSPGDGYICLFNEAYISSDIKAILTKFYALFEEQDYPFVFLSNTEYDLFLTYFRQLEMEYNSDFDYKTELLHSLLRLIIFQAIKLRKQLIPEVKVEDYPNKLSQRFMHLLNSQFPVDSPLQPIPYKTAGDFAGQLFVHVNHLNHSLKEAIGKSTTQLINERICLEAKDLLQNSDWSITEIAFSLGFDYPQHFTTFFKKHTGQNPKHFRLLEFKNI